MATRSKPVTDFPAVFAGLRAILAKHAAKLQVTKDDDEWYYLEAPKKPAPNGGPMHFGAVRLGKRYVSCYLMPAYTNPELLDGLSDGLRKRMQGKSCFNFTAADPALFRELAKLTDAGMKQFRADGYV